VDRFKSKKIAQIEVEALVPKSRGKKRIVSADSKNESKAALFTVISML
jgi:hypothetical protein